ncbi:1816_t:CDS:1, partial [Cetraspora pellucida]
KHINFEEILDNDVIERIFYLNEINKNKESSEILDNDLLMIQEDNDNSTIHSNEE